MPLNEARGRRRAGLTPQQKKEQLAAIYGVPQEIFMPELSGAEIERMREIVQAHDRQHKPMQEMDLNKPPQQRYVHQEYPKMLYHHDERESTTVQNADEEQAAREEGFTHEPYSSEPEEVQLDADAQREVAAIEKRLDEIRSKAAKKQKAKARRPE